MSNKMYVVIKEDASNEYMEKEGRLANMMWAETLHKIEGKKIEVETDYLFNNQFNTVPVRGVSDNGLRIMEEYVAEVINDKREGSMRCGYCGKCNKQADMCPDCNKSEYLENLG